MYTVALLLLHYGSGASTKAAVTGLVRVYEMSQTWMDRWRHLVDKMNVCCLNTNVTAMGHIYNNVMHD